MKFKIFEVARKIIMLVKIKGSIENILNYARIAHYDCQKLSSGNFSHNKSSISSHLKLIIEYADHINMLLSNNDEHEKNMKILIDKIEGNTNKKILEHLKIKFPKHDFKIYNGYLSCDNKIINQYLIDFNKIKKVHALCEILDYIIEDKSQRTKKILKLRKLLII